MLLWYLAFYAAVALAVDAGWYQPAVGSTRQIEMLNPLTNTSIDVEVFDGDLFANSAQLIDSIHESGNKSICYFSAGSFENWRPGAGHFKPSDYGNPLGGSWAGEYWLNTSSPNVRRIMLQRLDRASSKGCDAVDPDNIDGYENDNGLGLTEQDSIGYMMFLSQAAHSRGMGIGLKNGGDLILNLLSSVDFSVNEQCIQYSQCDIFQPFIEANKLVFHIEYVDGNPTSSQIQNYCDNNTEQGFSTLIKHIDLDDWYVACPASDMVSTTSASSSGYPTASTSASATASASSGSALNSEAKLSAFMAGSVVIFHLFVL